MNLLSTPACAALAFAVCVVVAPVVLVVLRRAHVLDVPNARSSHLASTPRGGGIAPALACGVAALVAADLTGASRAGILFVAVGVGGIGLVEDLRGVAVVPRLLGQVAVASVALVWLGRIVTVGGGWRPLLLVAVVLWVVAYVNAFNFMDGINGISVVQTVIAGAVWFAVGRGVHAPALAAAGLIAAAAAAAFAPFNMPRASMFLGDVGSYFLGGWLAVAAVIGLSAGIAPEAVLAPLALYVADTAATLVRRIRRHEPWHRPHRDHAYQRLTAAGWSHTRTASTVAVAVALTSALACLSLTGVAALRASGDLLAVGCVLAYLALPRVLARGQAHDLAG